MIHSASRALLITTVFSFAATFSIFAHAQPLALPKPQINTVQHQVKVRAPIQSKASTQRWAVKVGRFSSEEDVKKTVKLLQNKGFDGFVKETKTTENTFSEVYAGPTKHRSEAETLYNRLKQSYISAKVVPTEFNEEEQAG